MNVSNSLRTNNTRSAEIMARARGRFPGGVNSPVRAFRGVGGEPFVAARGKGAFVWDADGNEYIDYILSWGPLVLGHAPQVVLDALAKVMQDGTSFGMPTEREVDLADMIAARMPHLEMVRFTSSGTEAAMSIARLARAITKREYILKFEGCYHGHADAFLVRAGSGVATLGLPDSPGVPEALAKLTLTCAYNDLEAVEKIAREVPLAAIMLEPIVGNGGYIEPTAEFIPGLRRIADETGALLVFDEVMTGFRIAYGGAAERFGVTPDLTALGKVIGGGLPVAAYGGKREFMEHIAPTGPVYQAGTLSGNPLAMAGGLATLGALTREVHDGITAQTANLVQGMRDIAARHGVPFTASHSGSMWGFFFRDGVVRTFEDAKLSDVSLFKRFFHAARRRGVSLAPSAFEAAFMSSAHGPAEIAETLNRLDDALGAALAERD
ncbi:glutamate-1-semialdehyde 2,1-aminomutase [Gemmatimonas phototrophica]|uniref:Glutamate-1-semialdehyde 2,1-aminomutase n=1 Tax=Gemmatimonas phototrophica TaxID=1379270 RepID=A0A143BJ45_9BACT|nr:glutamate-1-semialdehyde 2,1-aminomutase [Gemmatimonas phototrophica]AMW04623.1 glutamate-1-semialdehyde aminotransferase [Gemmatimonas phototrophica]